MNLRKYQNINTLSFLILLDDDLLDYEEETAILHEKKDTKQVKKDSYVGLHSSSFKDFLLKSELNRAIMDCGFEHPSEVQHECIPQAILGGDIICQAKSGMGKTAVFTLATLQQIDPKETEISVVVLCHTRELAFQIHHEYQRFSKYLKDIKSAVFFGGVPVDENRKTLKNERPQIVIGTPGRMLQLSVKDKVMNLNHTKHFVLDECDKMLEKVDMRKDVQNIFMSTPHNKQVMLFSATLAKDIRPVCKKFCQDPMEIYVDDETRLTLHGLQQHYVNLDEKEKNRKLTDLLDDLDFNQVIIFTRKVKRAKELNALLIECNFPSMEATSNMKQEMRLEVLNKFKNFEARILVTTDLMGRGIDIEHVNVVINYDFPDTSDAYLHRVNRAGRFGTKGLAISFVSSPADEEVLKSVQGRFEASITTMPETIDTSTYMAA